MTKETASRLERFALVAAAAAVTATAVAVVVGSIRRRKKEKLPPYPPGPPGHWLWGNSLDFPDPSTGILAESQSLEWSKKYGLFFAIHFPGMTRPMIVVCDPDLLKKLMIRKHFPKDATYEIYHTVVGNHSLLVTDGAEWTKLRRCFRPGFSPKFLKEMVPIMASKVDQLIQSIEQDIDFVEGGDEQQHVQEGGRGGKATSTKERAQDFTSNVIVGVTFGEEWTMKKQQKTRLIEKKLLKMLETADFDPFLLLFGTLYRRFRTRPLEKEMDAIMMEVIERRLAEQQKHHQQQKQKEKPESGVETDQPQQQQQAQQEQEDHRIMQTDTSILARAIRAFQQVNAETGTKAELTDDDKRVICHQLKSFFFAGQDTTSVTIAWTLWRLSLEEHKDILEKIRDECKKLNMWTVAPQQGQQDNDNDGGDKRTSTTTSKLRLDPPTYEQLQQCTYLEAVLYETLRMYPPVGSFTRYEADETLTYKGYQIGGCVIGINVYALHHHPDVWKDPEEYRPERFLDGSDESNIEDKFLSFSRGPRNCIGKHFAMLEAKLAISAISMRFDSECVHRDESLAASVLTFPWKGAMVKFRRSSMYDHAG